MKFHGELLHKNLAGSAKGYEYSKLKLCIFFLISFFLQLRRHKHKFGSKNKYRRLTQKNFLIHPKLLQHMWREMITNFICFFSPTLLNWSAAAGFSI